MGRSRLFATTIFLFSTLILSTQSQQIVLDVTKYGAQPGSDITQTLLTVWEKACESTSRVKILIPSAEFKLGLVTLAGPCKTGVDIQVDGTLKAPEDVKLFKEKGFWVNFIRINDFRLMGEGTFDGQGKLAWESAETCKKTMSCKQLPISMRFDYITNGLISDITSLNSKNFHINVLGANNLTFNNVKIIASDDSVNTDGIHIGRSDKVYIYDSVIKTGDDCISIGDGSKNVEISKITCGPGHGISIGSLGRYTNEEPVFNIYIKNSIISNTDNGLRIKTWPNSYPMSASNIEFVNIIVNNVTNPIIIDQIYCPWNLCDPKIPSKVKLSNIKFNNIQGTTPSQIAVKLSCSSDNPCENVQLSEIDVRYTGKGQVKSECSNVKPKFSGKQNPAACV